MDISNWRQLQHLTESFATTSDQRKVSESLDELKILSDDDDAEMRAEFVVNSAYAEIAVTTPKLLRFIYNG